jgi:SAM-dependent methyltransferase
MTGQAALPLPPQHLRFMGEDDEKLVETAAELARLVLDRGLPRTGAVLDVGCGYGRLALGLHDHTEFEGTYLGFDILRKHVRWCRQNLTPLAPGYRFRHADIHNARYNPDGKVDPGSFRFPAPIGTTDAIALFSIFTHFYRSDIEHYLREFRRVLKPGGVAITTWFLYDEQRLPVILSEGSAFAMVHELDEHTRYFNADDPLHAIAYEESFVRRMAAEAGLEVVSVDRGTWTGEAGLTYQDLVVLRRPGALVDRVRATLGHLRRRLTR